MVWEVVAQPCSTLCMLVETPITNEWLDVQQPQEPGAQVQRIGAAQLQAWNAAELCCVVAFCPWT